MFFHVTICTSPLNLHFIVINLTIRKKNLFNESEGILYLEKKNSVILKIIAVWPYQLVQLFTHKQAVHSVGGHIHRNA